MDQESLRVLCTVNGIDLSDASTAMELKKHIS